MYHPVATLWTFAESLFLFVERDASPILRSGEWMPARLGKAWPSRHGGNSRVMIYLAFGLENDFPRYRIVSRCPTHCERGCVVELRHETASRREKESEQNDAVRARIYNRAAISKRWTVRCELVADRFISRKDGTANLTECPTRRGAMALLIESD